jgi:exodeoxyribonuclease-3
LVKYFVEGKTNWTFWGYRGGGWQKGNGLRIDHFLTTENVTDLIRKVEVNREPRGWEKASDHTPVTITLEN